MKGLFFHRNGHRLPDQYEALVFNEESVQKWPVETLNVFQENVIKRYFPSPVLRLAIRFSLFVSASTLPTLTRHIGFSPFISKQVFLG